MFYLRLKKVALKISFYCFVLFPSSVLWFAEKQREVRYVQRVPPHTGLHRVQRVPREPKVSLQLQETGVNILL